MSAMTILLALRARLVRRALPLVLGVIALAATRRGIDHARLHHVRRHRLHPLAGGAGPGAHPRRSRHASSARSSARSARTCAGVRTGWTPAPPSCLPAPASTRCAGTRPSSGWPRSWRDRIFLYQVWRNPRAKVGWRPVPARRQGARHRRPARSADPGGPAQSRRRSPRRCDVEALVEMLARQPGRAPAGARVRRAALLAHVLAHRRHHARARVTSSETRELMGGVVLPEEFRTLERQLGD